MLRSRYQWQSERQQQRESELAVTGIQVVLKENLSICRISCQIGGPGLRWIRAISFRWMPKRSRPKSVARTSSAIISVPDERDVTSGLSCHPPEKERQDRDGECRYKHRCTDRKRYHPGEIEAGCDQRRFPHPPRRSVQQLFSSSLSPQHYNFDNP